MSESLISLVKRGPSSSLASLAKEATTGQTGSPGQESLYILIDASASMSGPDENGAAKWDAAVKATNGLLLACTPATRAGIISFSSKHKIVCRLILPAAASEELLRHTPALEGTCMAPPLEDAMIMLNDTHSQVKRIVCMTDGECMDDDRCLELAKQCRERKVIIDTVGFAVHPETQGFLTMLATATGGVYKDARNATELVKQFKLLTAAARGLLKA